MLLQALNVLPLFVVPEADLPARLAVSGLYRATGLKYDPNIAALMLVIGLALALGDAGRRMVAARVFIAVGIVTTLSRMGILVGLGMFMIAGFQRRSTVTRILHGTAGTLIATLLIAVSAAVGTFVASPEVTEYVSERFAEVAITYQQVMAGDLPSGRSRHLTSSQARMVLAKGALDSAMSHWVAGVGAYGTEEAIFEAVSLENVAHNTYLELFLIGGVWGLACVYFYCTVVIGSLRVTWNRPDLTEARRVVVAAVTSVACGSMFLSITYTSLLWAPAFLALGLRYHVRRARAHQGGVAA